MHGCKRATPNVCVLLNLNPKNTAIQEYRLQSSCYIMEKKIPPTLIPGSLPKDFVCPFCLYVLSEPHLMSCCGAQRLRSKKKKWITIKYYLNCFI